MNIVVSGIGIVSPLGNGREATWSRLLKGETAIRKGLRGLEAAVFDFSPNGACSRMGDFALLAAGEALAHAGISECLINSRRIGCAVSQSKPVIARSTEGLDQRATNVRVGATWQSHEIASSASGGLAMTDINPSLLLSSFFGWSPESLIQWKFGLEGPSANVTAACATGVVSLLTGVQWLEAGECDFVLAGASESSLGDFYFSGFKQMGVLAAGDNPCSVRPFDRNRSGFAMGEGAAVLILEKESSARARNHPPLARIKNIRMVHNAFEAVKFDESGWAVFDLIRKTAGDEAVDYINAHGTGTRLNDLVEARGIKAAFPGNRPVPLVSSTKAATGHLLGAAGALEAAICVLALRDQAVPATLHLENPDPDCPVSHVRSALRMELNSVLSLSYGFGGQMGAVLLEKIS